MYAYIYIYIYNKTNKHTRFPSRSTGTAGDAAASGAADRRAANVI